MSLLQVGELFAEAVRADRSLSAEEATEILNRIDPSFFPRSDGCRDQSAWQKIDQLMSVLETILLTLTDEQSQAFITVLNFIDEHEIPLILGDLSTPVDVKVPAGTRDAASMEQHRYKLRNYLVDTMIDRIHAKPVLTAELKSLTAMLIETTSQSPPQSGVYYFLVYYAIKTLDVDHFVPLFTALEKIVFNASSTNWLEIALMNPDHRVFDYISDRLPGAAATTALQWSSPVMLSEPNPRSLLKMIRLRGHFPGSIDTWFSHHIITQLAWVGAFNDDDAISRFRAWRSNRKVKYDPWLIKLRRDHKEVMVYLEDKIPSSLIDLSLQYVV